MARTPSLTLAEAESLLGPRGYLNVSAANRGNVRKWLTAHGLPAQYVVGLAMKAMQSAYNDTSDRALNDLRRRAKEGIEELGGDATESTATATAQSAANTATQSVSGDATALAQLLTEMLAKGGVDADKVNAIIDARWNELPDLIAKHATVRRIELVKADGAIAKVEGHAHEKLADLIKVMNSRQANGRHPNIMIKGETGSGKSHGVHQASVALGKGFHTNGAIDMDHQLIGFRDAGGTYHTTPFREAFAKPDVYLFDEIDSSGNSPLLALAGALANGGHAFPDMFVERHPDSVIVAAGNTWGHGATADFVGRNKLDAAIRSRFPVRIQWDIDESLERNISGNVDWTCRVQKARAKARAAGLKVVIDPRMSQAGAALIASGFTMQQAAEMTYLADLTADQRRIVEG